MNKYEIIRRIEEFAPLETQEKWDCSGWGVNVGVNVMRSQCGAPESYCSRNTSRARNSTIPPLRQSASERAEQSLIAQAEEVNKILFALTVTDDVVRQAREKGCDMIISHHPLFYVPLEYKDINIYCAHTNLDRANGGTTDRLIEKLGFSEPHPLNPSLKGRGNENDLTPNTSHQMNKGKVIADGFVRIVELETPITVDELRDRLLKISPRLRYINNCGAKTVQTIGFCAGSGSEFIGETDAFVTGDLKFHTALEAKKVVFDIGHFESEIFAPELLKEITGIGERGVIADEKSPFI